MLRESVKLPFTSVVSYHTNEYGCGVAKFGKMLAERLGVPFVGMSLSSRVGAYPLYSLKWSELSGNVDDPAPFVALDGQFGVFWHDGGFNYMTRRAAHVFFADPSLGSPGLWCPSLLAPSASRLVKLFTFGMAHKLNAAHYATVRAHLEAAGLDYRLRVSVGLHEGTSLSDATQHFAALYDVLGRDKVTILGILSDDAVREELRDADCVLAFFQHGARLNNTTVHAAIESRRPAITNHDNHTHPMLKSMTKDVSDSRWVENLIHKRHPFSWDALISRMEELYAATRNRQRTAV